MKRQAGRIEDLDRRLAIANRDLARRTPAAGAAGNGQGPPNRSMSSPQYLRIGTNASNVSSSLAWPLVP